MGRHMLVFLWLLFVTKVCVSCPNNWIGHESSCYHFSHDVEQWADAMDICKILGGYVVEINSELENSFIQNNMKYGYSWIGASDLLEEGVWRWMTSLSSLGYSAWQPGEPNNSGENENCVLVYKGSSHHGWNDAACNKPFTYVCEREARFKHFF